MMNQRLAEPLGVFRQDRAGTPLIAVPRKQLDTLASQLRRTDDGEVQAAGNRLMCSQNRHLLSAFWEPIPEPSKSLTLSEKVGFSGHFRMGSATLAHDLHFLMVGP